MAKLTKSIEAKDTELRSLKASLTNLQNIHQKLLAENERIRGEMQQRSSRAALLETEKYQTEARIDKLQMDLRRRDEELARLRTEVQELRVRANKKH